QLGLDLRAISHDDDDHLRRCKVLACGSERRFGVDGGDALWQFRVVPRAEVVDVDIRQGRGGGATRFEIRRKGPHDRIATERQFLVCDWIDAEALELLDDL